MTNSPLLKTDTLIVNRGGVDHCVEWDRVCPSIDQYEELPKPKMPWVGHNGGIWHIKNLEDDFLAFAYQSGNPNYFIAWDIDGTNERQITRIDPGEELVFATPPSCRGLFNGNRRNTAKWDFGEHTDTSKVTDTSYLLEQCQGFNGTLGGNWDTSNVRDMDSMFNYCYEFNQDISAWDVSKVANMKSMFLNAYEFNQDLNGWDVSKVRNMLSMFMGAKAFNGDISGWDVSRLPTMQAMFSSAEAFNQDIGGWDVSNVTEMRSLFSKASDFNQDLSGWCVTKITSKPEPFDGGATAWTKPRPVWGTCPPRTRGENKP